MHSKIICTFVPTRGSRLVNWLVIEAKRSSQELLFVFYMNSIIEKASTNI